MNLPPRAMADEIASTGFGAEPLEQVSRLMALLDALNSHPFLKSRIALKGGTALNLFHFEVPRLSVDIDLNYIGAADRTTMLAERPMVEQAIQAVCSREGLNIRRVPTEHAGGKWRLTYAASKGAPGNLELDINYLLRTPLWPWESGIATRSVRGVHPRSACWTFTSWPPGNSRRSSPAAPSATSSMRMQSSARPASTPRGSVSASSSTVGSTVKTGGRYHRPM